MEGPNLVVSLERDGEPIKLHGWLKAADLEGGIHPDMAFIYLTAHGEAHIAGRDKRGLEELINEPGSAAVEFTYRGRAREGIAAYRVRARANVKYEGDSFTVYDHRWRLQAREPGSDDPIRLVPLPK